MSNPIKLGDEHDGIAIFQIGDQTIPIDVYDAQIKLMEIEKDYTEQRDRVRVTREFMEAIGFVNPTFLHATNFTNAVINFLKDTQKKILPVGDE